MRFDQFTFKAQEVIQNAQKQAEEMQHQAVDVEHLLLALVEQTDGILLPVLQKVGASPRQIAASLRQELGKLPKVYGPSQTYMTPRLNEVFKRAQDEAGRLKDEYVGSEHLLLGILGDTSGAAVGILGASGVTRMPSTRLCKVSVAVSGSRIRTRKRNTRRCNGTAGTSPISRRKGSWTPSLGGTTRSAGSSRYSLVGRRITPS